MTDPCVPFVRLDVSGVDDPLAEMAVVLYVAGCSRRCPGCHNPSLQTTKGHTLIPVSMVVKFIDRFLTEKKAADLVASVVFQGGDWAEYPDAYVALAGVAHKRKYRTVLYTGELYENLPKNVREVSDWVVDGPWDENAVGVFPPSDNQRVFKQGQRVDPEQLPLRKHLLASRSDGPTEAEQGG